MRATTILFGSALVMALAVSGCSSDDNTTPDLNSQGGSSLGGAAGSGGTAGGAGASTGGSGGSSAQDAGDAAPDAPSDSSIDAPVDHALPDAGPVVCPVTLTYAPGGSPTSIKVAGEWNNFDLASAPTMNPNGNGAYTTHLDLAPGFYGYKYVVDGDWRLDPTQGRRKYLGSPPIENSGLLVRNCGLPSAHVDAHNTTRTSAGAGTFDASLSFVDAFYHGSPAPSAYKLTLQRNGKTQTIPSSAATIDGTTGNVTVHLTDLQDGKYRMLVSTATQDGRVGEPVRLIFWVEAQPFTWNGALIYMVMTDRYRDGDKSNDPGPTAGADPRGDWHGGDLEGVTASINDGTFDKLGVRALWLTPFQTNPQSAFPAADGVHQVTGYHGYWPIKAREVDPRIGGNKALQDLAAAAHAHGIRILQDFVVNHVHKDHEYVKAHPDWFRQGCVCGTQNCGWTEHALDCMFASYLPDVNHTNWHATQAFVDDAVWWADTFDLDGYRVDAVKHVEEAATRNLAAEVREDFELAGTRYFMMGETAMGWSECDDPCNDQNYGTISKYIGPQGLDGQFDFVLYHAVSYNTFAYENKGMLHADYWLQHGLQKYPAGAIMTPYIGSHDTPRFVTLADPDHTSKAHNQWSDIAGQPTSQVPFDRARPALAWLLGLPGAPLLYYGDEYGQWGGADPNNRMMWRPEAQLSAREKALLAFTRKAGSARKQLKALQTGEYISLKATEDSLLYARRLGSGQAALVGLTRAGGGATLQAEVTTKLGFAGGTTLHDSLGGPDVTVSGSGQISVPIPAHGAVILAP